jgi:hypothetical protein
MFSTFYCNIKRMIKNLMERVKGIEPSYSAWEAAALPLSYTRNAASGKPAAAPRQVCFVAFTKPRAPQLPARPFH